MKTHKHTIIIGTFIVLSIVLLSTTLFMINKMTKQLHSVEQIERHLDSMDSQLHGITSETVGALEQWKDEQLWIQGVSYEIDKVDVANNTVVVTFEWQLSELKEDENITFLYKNNDDNVWEEVQAKNNGGLNYYVTRTLPLRANYETQVNATSTTGKRSEGLISLDIKNQINDRFNISMHLDQLEKGKYSMYVDGYKNEDYYDVIHFYDNDKFEIKSAQAFFFVNGKEVEVFDLTDLDPNMESSQDFHLSETIDLAGKSNIDLATLSEVTLKVVIADHYGFTYTEEVSL